MTLDAELADLVVGVRKGTGKIANPTVNGGPVDSRPGTVEATDDVIRVGVMKGRPPDVTQSRGPLGTNGTGGSTTDAHWGRSGRAGRYVQGVSGKSAVPVDGAAQRLPSGILNHASEVLTPIKCCYRRLRIAPPLLGSRRVRPCQSQYWIQGRTHTGCSVWSDSPPRFKL